MKKTITLLLIISVFALTFVNCEKERLLEPELAQNIEKDVRVNIVKLTEIPIIENFLAKKINTTVLKSTAINGAIFDEDHIMELIDTLDRTNYTFRFKYPDTPVGVFYNLVVNKDENGELKTPYVLKYTSNDADLEGYIQNNFSLGHFKGKVSLHKYTDFFKAGSFLKASSTCPSELDENGDPIPCDQINVDGSGGTSGGGPSEPSGDPTEGGSGSYSDCSTVFYIKDCGGSNSDAWHTYGSCGGPWKDTRRANYMSKVECEEISKSARLKSYNDCPECPEPIGSIGVSSSTVFNLSALTAQQKELFNTAKEELAKNCLGAALLAATNQVNITMGATIASGQYQPDTNTIKFMSNGDIFSDILGAELFHAYQQQLYGTLSDIYNGTKTSGGSNMEFEEKAFNLKKEMIKGEGMFIFEEQETLFNWLGDLDINHPTGPIVLNQSELDGWFDALEEFQQFHEINNPDLHYADPIDYNQNPNAILNLINRALEADCN